MTYATAQDYIAFYGEQEAIEQTNLDDTSADTFTDENAQALNQMLASASAEINGHLAAKYTLPIPEPYPAMLTEIAVVIARKNLDRYRRREHVQKDYDQAIDRLRRIAKGEEVLIGDGGNPIDNSAGTAGEVGFRAGRRTFSEGNLGSYGRSWA